MKYSFMSFSTPDLSFPDMLATARRYGYDGIEPRLDAEHAHGVEVGITGAQRWDVREQAAAAGIEIACIATSLKYADPAETDTMIQQTHERIDLAADVGSCVLRVFGGGIPSGVSREQAIDIMVESLCAVADHAGERGVKLSVETHDDWCDPVHVAAVLERVNHAAVGVNWDVMHPVRTGAATIEESFEILKPWVYHLHIHDGVGGDVGLVPIGTGDIDHKAVLECLQTVDYTGYLSGEWISWEPYDIHLPRELAAMKGYEQELG